MPWGRFRNHPKPDDSDADNGATNSTDESQNPAQPDAPTASSDNGLTTSFPDKDHAHVVYTHEREERSEGGDVSIDRKIYAVDIHIVNLGQAVTNLNRLGSAQPDRTGQGRIGSGDATHSDDSDGGRTDSNDE